MPSLKIHLLGQFKLQTNNEPIELPSRPAQSLLAYLVLNAGVKQRREKLAHLLWPDATERNARGYLRQALWRIRKSLTAASLIWEDFLQINDINVAFDNQSDYWLDAEIVMASTETQSVEDMIETVRLYRGELLPGFYDEWVVLARDRLQAAYHQKMNLLTQNLITTKQWDNLLIWAEEWIRLGYAPEPAFRGLMVAHVGLGDQGMVNATYRRCVESLDRELSLEPSPETIQLYEQIQRGEIHELGASPVHLPDPGEQIPEFLKDRASPQIDRPLFVARERELTQLGGFLDQAFAGQGRVIFITGEIGSGKTALVDEFARRAQKANPDLIIVRGNCNAHTGSGDPYLPFREVMELLTGDVAARWAAGSISREHAKLLWNILPQTVQALVEVGPDLIDTFVSSQLLVDRAAATTSENTDWFVRLEELIHRKTSGAVHTNMLQSDLFEQYTKVLQALARQAPIILVVDDLQWADLGSISLLFHLGRHLLGHRILIIGAYRPEEIALGRDGTRHPLESVINEFQREYGDIAITLGKAEHRDFINAILDSESNRLGASFREMLYRQTHGHPLFTIELLRGMQERGDLVQNPVGQWEEGLTLDWETVPARVEAVIAERIGRLDQPVQEVLRVASVEGQVFTAEVIAQVCGTPERDILGLLSQDLDRKHHLIRSHSIQRLGDQLISCYRFRHILFQKYLYNSLDEVERVHLHEQIGITLEGLYQDDDERAIIAPQLARHFQEARIVQKGVHYLHQAGEKALQLSAYREGIVHLTRGLELLMTLPESPERDQQELLLQLTLSFAWQGRIGAQAEEVGDALIRARELCQLLGQTSKLCQVMGGLAINYYVRAEYQKAIDLAEETLRLAHQVDDPLIEALGHWFLGLLLMCIGKFTTALSYLDKVTVFYEPQHHHHTFVYLRGSDAGVGALAYQACCLWCLGYPDQALERSRDALALAWELDHPFTLQDALCFAGCMLGAMRRDAGTVKESSDEMKRLAQEKNLVGWLGSGARCGGDALVLMGQNQEGITQINLGLADLRSIGILLHFSGSLGFKGEAQLKEGKPTEALITLDEALELVEGVNERVWEAELYRLRGDILLALDSEEEAEASYQRAIQVARDQQAKSWELRAATALGRLWKKQGKSDQAHHLLAEIYDWFTEGFETPDLKAARVLLEQLS